MRMFGEIVDASPPEVTNCTTRYMKIARATTTQIAAAPAKAAGPPPSHGARIARGITRTMNRTTATRFRSR